MTEEEKKRIGAEVAEAFDRALDSVDMCDFYRCERTWRHVEIESAAWVAFWKAIDKVCMIEQSEAADD